MKTLASILLLVSFAANAAQPPAQLQSPVPVAYQHQQLCGGTVFNADDTISGMCRDSIGSACSGRGCQPVINYTFYTVTWDDAGNPIAFTQCATMRHHLPQANQWTYAPGFDATNCANFSLGTPTTVEVNGVWYYYVTTSADGAYEIVNGQSASYVVGF